MTEHDLFYCKVILESGNTALLAHDNSSSPCSDFDFDFFSSIQLVYRVENNLGGNYMLLFARKSHRLVPSDLTRNDQ